MGVTRVIYVVDHIKEKLLYICKELNVDSSDLPSNRSVTCVSIPLHYVSKVNLLYNKCVMHLHP